jgi:hypothetical protein
MVQRAKGQAIADHIKPLWMGVWHDMRGIHKVQLNAAHGTPVGVRS